ncbi:YciI family protein [Amycolatopsis thermoflava]|uniref:YciI family protein n=1 Tax=Amycolatopsis thermoflava TaxID=84480 RepID=UPI00040755B7|nr:YciI family protein [Amycolatopsis thermoflava]
MAVAAGSSAWPPRRPDRTLERADLDEAVKLAAQLPAAWDGVVEVRPVIEF